MYEPLRPWGQDRDLHNKCFRGRIWCIRDICGIICAVLTWLLVIYAEIVVLSVIYQTETHPIYSTINVFLFNVFAILALTSHTRAMFTDPGAVPKGNATRENIERMGLKEGQVIFKCPKCCSIKPQRAHHCSVCQRCIRKMDHHCPWVNNCVGENNQKYFVLFTLYIALLSLHGLILGVHQFIICVGNEWKECSSVSPPTTVILLLFLIFESLLFAIFTAVMFLTQLSAIWNDETGNLWTITRTLVGNIVALSYQPSGFKFTKSSRTLYRKLTCGQRSHTALDVEIESLMEKGFESQWD